VVVNRIIVRGLGAVSPAGWGVDPLREVCADGKSLPIRDLPCAGNLGSLKVRAVPQNGRFLNRHARMRRTSPIAQYAVAAALEALGGDAESVQSGALRLGIVYCAMSGCVNFSRRFYDETLKDPATASPVIFPETVFNAPSSHLGALLGSGAVNYTLVGDPGTFLQGIALAADWLTIGRVDGCLVIGAEELDWLVAQAFDLFDPAGIVSEGAGAVYLRQDTDQAPAVELQAITQPHLFSNKRTRAKAALQARAELGESGENSLLCDGTQGVRRLDEDEKAAWAGWTGGRWSPKTFLGEGFMAASAWQCVLAIDALFTQRYVGANVSVVGCNQQAIAARFGRS
jgi:hypothetical protein